MVPVKGTAAMIAGMSPELLPGRFTFVTVPPGDPRIAGAQAMMQEAEGTSLILPAEDDAEMPMRQITLTVHSALDGVGLTAAVAHALAEIDVPCNVVAGHHHDHIFVPEAQAEAALDRLKTLAAQA